jgi:serine/threonine protein kinase
MVNRFFGHYQIIGEAGYGGMGTVYRAQDTRTGQQVAIKLLPVEYLDDLGLRSSFYREAELVAGLEHEAIVPVYEFGEREGQPYIAMQYMPNGPLADRLVQGPIPAERVGSILKPISAAIDYAHEQGVIHGDLKPSNILFDENDQPYLADFGIAWHEVTNRRSGPVSGGTPAYLSPEQALGEEKIDDRSDIYALGIILFEMLTGVLPFEGETPLAVILMHVYDPPPSLRVADWRLPASLDVVIQRALAKKPDDRYASAGELLEAFQSALAAHEHEISQNEMPVHEPMDDATSIVERSKGTVRNDLTSHRADEPQSLATVNLPIPIDPPDVIASLNAEVKDGWGCAHLLTLGLATVFSVLFAAALVAFIRFAPVRPSQPGIMMTYDNAAISLTNQSNAPIDLSKVVFRQLTADGKLAATFLASDWLQLPANSAQKLEPGACYQLIDPNKSSIRLTPGDAPPKPTACNKLQAWMTAGAQDWLFWVSRDGSTSFQVLLNGRVIRTCPIAAGVCEFILTRSRD